MNKDKTFSNENSVNSKTSSGTDSSAQVLKKITTLKQTLSQTTKNAEQMDKAIRQKKSELNEMNVQIEESSDSLQKIEAECYDRNIELTIRKLERNANILLISCL